MIVVSVVQWMSALLVCGKELRIVDVDENTFLYHLCKEEAHFAARRLDRRACFSECLGDDLFKSYYV
jgi:hypothetical protein